MSQLRIAYYGLLHEASGYGTAARTYVHALHRAGVDLCTINLTLRKLVRDPLVEDLARNRFEPDLHLFHCVPSMLPPLTLYLDRVIAMTVWETDRMCSQWTNLLDQVKEVWLPSRHNVEVFARALRTPVYQLPHAVPPPVPASDRGFLRAQYGIEDDTFVFYSIFAWQDRKCPLGIAEAFLRAFPRGADVLLLLKAGFGLWPERAARASLGELIDRIGSTARVEVISDVWSPEQIEALANRGDCYVSLHRGEGWCYPLFEAACKGQPVVATAYSAPAEYLDPAFQNLVRYRLAPVKQRFQFFEEGMMWADPDLEHAASLMRYVYENRDEARRRAAQGARELHQAYSLEAVGQAARRRLEFLLELERPVTLSSRRR
jgi:glycosyltransferase involved in cell wall biosynthesis